MDRLTHHYNKSPAHLPMRRKKSGQGLLRHAGCNTNALHPAAVAAVVSGGPPALALKAEAPPLAPPTRRCGDVTRRCHRLITRWRLTSVLFLSHSPPPCDSAVPAAEGGIADRGRWWGLECRPAVDRLGRPSSPGANPGTAGSSVSPAGSSSDRGAGLRAVAGSLGGLSRPDSELGPLKATGSGLGPPGGGDPIGSGSVGAEGSAGPGPGVARAACGAGGGPGGGLGVSSTQAQ